MAGTSSKSNPPCNIPETQAALQLTGPGRLVLNTAKPVTPPGPHQILCRVEAVGLCFSDLKLLKQFNTHARKTPILSGIDQHVLDEIPSYVPGDAPAVPGHETVVRVTAVGPGVTDFHPGERYLVQTDYRWLPTASSNASFGYNFEGGLQQYVLMDQRIITSPSGQSMLISASESLSASSIALVEPWACVEDAYATTERTRIKTDGRMLIAADAHLPDGYLTRFFDEFGTPADITWLSDSAPPQLTIPVIGANSLANLEDALFDDIVYLGSNAETVETLFDRLAPAGVLNVTLCGGKLDRNVEVCIGRVHYGGVRIVGTAGSDPAEAMRHIVTTGEIRPGARINVIGAAGPMGLMHVVRDICQAVPDIAIWAGDTDDVRLGLLSAVAAPLARGASVRYESYNPTVNPPDGDFDYTVLMVPVVELIDQAIRTTAPGGVINIFAGIGSAVPCTFDLDSYIRKHMYFVGTSGSTLDDMKVVLDKVQTDRLDTNLSVAGVSGMAGAADGLHAVEERLIPGKIIVYPACTDLPLTTLDQLPERVPAIAGILERANGLWTKAAEDALLGALAGQ